MAASLCCPEIYDRTGGTGLFSKTQRTARRLEQAAKAAGAAVMTPTVAAPKHDCRPKAISAIERHFLQSGGEQPQANGEVKIVTAADVYDEAEGGTPAEAETEAEDPLAGQVSVEEERRTLLKASRKRTGRLLGILLAAAGSVAVFLVGTAVASAKKRKEKRVRY